MWGDLLCALAALDAARDVVSGLSGLLESLKEPERYHNKVKHILALHGAGHYGADFAVRLNLADFAADLNYTWSAPDGTVGAAAGGLRGWTGEQAELDRLAGLAPPGTERVWLGHSHGAFAAIKAALYYEDPAIVIAGGLLSRDAWMTTDRSVPALFVHGSRDVVVWPGGGITPIGNTTTLESYLGPLHAAALLDDGPLVEQPRINLIEALPTDDPVTRWLIGTRFNGAETRRYTRNLCEVWTISGAGHVDVLGRHACRKILEWAVGQA